MYAANDFVASEITSDQVSGELKKWATIFPWIDDDSTSTYFELVTSPPDSLKNVALMASKTYSRGLVIISIYLESMLYFVVQGGEGDQHLLDVRFPDVSRRGQGLHVASYKEEISFWRRLTLWHNVETEKGGSSLANSRSQARIMQATTTDISSNEYIQAYCILKSKEKNAANPTASSLHEAMFRFGSWCYSGSVQLTPTITLADVPFVIPALRIQQSRLAYYCDVKHMPSTNRFTKALGLVQKISPIIEDQIYKSEEALTALIDRLNRMNLGDSVSRWLEGDSDDSFFEFKFAKDIETERLIYLPIKILPNYFHSILGDVEVIASKAYHASGVVTVTIIYDVSVFDFD